MCKCRSHGTFPLRLQSSHLNICYYHQDLHRRRPPARASRFCSDRRAPTHRGLALAPTAADFDFHDHRPAVLIDQHPLWVLELASELQLSRGKLRGNQLLDGSISLSPLYPSQTNDLHARSPWPPPEFLWLRPARHSSPSFGPDRHAHTQPFSLLVRVSRRVEWGAHRPTPEHADAEARREARAADHDKAATPPLAQRRGATGSGTTGSHLSGALSRELGPGPPLRTLPDYTNAKTPDFQAGLFPAFDQTIDDLTRIEFTTACQDALASLARFWPTARADVPRQKAWGATCAQRLDGSRILQFTPSIDFATLFIDASRDIRCRVALDFTLQHRSNKHRLRLAKAGCLVECSLTLFAPGLVISEAMRIIQPNWAVTNDNHGIGRHEIS
ncbi:hypothetical protein Bca4012_102680 [Brassica carinata]